MINAEKQENRKNSLKILMLFCLSLLPLPWLLGFVPTVTFPAEEIDIDVFPEEIEVTGFYVYRNPWLIPVSQAYTIPFPIDATHPDPYWLSASNLSDPSKRIQTEKTLGENHFNLFFMPQQEIKVKVAYRQACLENNGCYLLRTTKPWNAPLEHGEYKIFLHGVKELVSNYKLEPTAKNSFAFKRSNFMPEEDWHLSWTVD